MEFVYPMGENGPWVFVLVTIILAGSAAWATGRAIALTWQPYWKLGVYVILLTLAARFLHFALFAEPFLTPQNLIADFLILAAFALAGHRFTRSRQMASQYPWLVKQAGFLGWRRVGDDA